MSQMISQMTGSLAANNAVTGPVSALNANVTVLVSGTFVGTVTLQATANAGTPVWIPVATAVTAPGIISLNNLCGDLSYRVIMTPFTSGTANVYIAACPTS